MGEDEFVDLGGKAILGREFASVPREVDQRQYGARLRSMPKLAVPVGGRPIRYDGDAHLITVAPTGSGKGRSVIIPNLLTYEGPIVVTDPKGENYAVTARARREMGHSVYRLDPFNVVDRNGDCLNPLDLFSLENTDIETDAQMMADLLSLRSGDHDFWDNSAFGLLSGVIAYIAALHTNEQSERTFSKLVETLNSDDVVYKLAVALDTVGKLIPKMAYLEISAFLQKADKERSGVLSTATSYLKAFMSRDVLRTLDSSSFPLDDIIYGRPISIYLIIPPAKLRSHSTLLRLWIGTILHCITSRSVIPKKRTLLLVDECAQLGTFSFLETAITLCRGYGLQVWTFWQDLSQIKGLYSLGWPSIVNNCGVVQVFGTKNFSVATQLAELLGLEVDDVRLLPADEQIVSTDGSPAKSKKFDYLSDDLLSGRYDANPFYAME